MHTLYSNQHLKTYDTFCQILPEIDRDMAGRIEPTVDIGLKGRSIRLEHYISLESLPPMEVMKQRVCKANGSLLSIIRYGEAIRFITNDSFIFVVGYSPRFVTGRSWWGLDHGL